MKKILTALFLITVFLVPQKAFALEDSRSFQVEQKDFLLQTSSGETISENILLRLTESPNLKRHCRGRTFDRLCHSRQKFN